MAVLRLMDGFFFTHFPKKFLMGLKLRTVLAMLWPSHPTLMCGVALCMLFFF